jgi:hypothetical protein
VIRERDGLQFDFRGKIDGVRSFESLRSRATVAKFGRHELMVASLDDIIRSKKAAKRPRDRVHVPEYWIVDLDSRLVERWRPDDGRPEIIADVLEWQRDLLKSRLVDRCCAACARPSRSTSARRE